MAIEDCFARGRLVAVDMAILFAKKQQGIIDRDQFSHFVTKIGQELDAYKQHVDALYSDDSCYATSDEISDLDPGEVGIVNHKEPRLLFREDHYIMNFVMLDRLALELVFKYKVGLTQGRRTSPELVELALKKCQIVEAIHHGPGRPDAVVFSYQASLAMVGLFVGTSRERIDWCRRKLAMAELAGYIYPFRVHQQMTKLWGEDVVDWWLPAGARLTPTIRLIREFDEFRKEPPRDLFYTDVWAMNGMFRSPDASDGGASADSHHPRVDSGHGHGSDTTGSMWSLQRDPVVTSG